MHTIQLILIVTGAVAAIAVLQLIAPAPVLRMIFGEAPTDEVGLAVARHWGLLTFLIGALLIYAVADHAPLNQRVPGSSPGAPPHTLLGCVVSKTLAILPLFQRHVRQVH